MKTKSQNWLNRSLTGILLAAFLFTALFAGGLDRVLAEEIGGSRYAGISGTYTASSETAGHGANLAADGDYETYWQTEDFTAATLTSDLGDVYSLNRVQQTFVNADVWMFTLEASLDGERWAVLADASQGSAGQTFGYEATGYYRYVRITVLGSELGYPATSAEFVVTGTAMSRGTNLALGMWGNGGGWLAGYEPEKAFDGNFGTWYCANDGGYPQWIAAEWEYDCFVTEVVLTFKDYGTYNFEMEGKSGNEWPKLRNAENFTGQTAVIPVNRTLSAVLYRVFSGPGWAGMVEMEVFGFKNVARNVSPAAASGVEVYDLGEVSYINRIERKFGTAAERAYQVEYSATNDENAVWNTLADKSEGDASAATSENVSAYGRYVRFTQLSGDFSAAEALAVYGTPLVRDLAQGIRGKVSDYSSDGYNFEGFNAAKATMNPEFFDRVANRRKDSYFWCTNGSAGPHWLELDLGNAVLVRDVTVKFQDPKGYKFSISASLDGSEWVTLRDESADWIDGQTFTAEPEGENLYRYFRVTMYMDGWMGVNQFQVNGVGSPVREQWWEKDSGVIRYYVKKQEITLNEITAQLDELRRMGYKAIELHQPYEGLADIWAGLGATNNYAIDPVAGTMDDLVRLIDEAHARDIKIIFFGNVGYTRETAPLFKKACTDYANGINSKEAGWFHFSKTCPDPTRWFWSDTANAYYYGYWGENGAIPSFNFNNQAWRDECKNYLNFWTSVGVDGVALDAPEVYDGLDGENAQNITANYITNILNSNNVWTNPEGARDPAKWVGTWNFKCMQDYSIGNWGGGAFSMALDAARSHNAAGIEGTLKNYRDIANNFWGSTLAPMCFEARYQDATYDQRAIEAALLTTIGNCFYIHNGTDIYIGQDIVAEWPTEEQNRIFSLMRTQNAYAALAPTGLRYQLPTNDNNKYYSFLRTNMNGNVKALVIFNYQDSAQEITVNLANAGISAQTPVDLLTGKAAQPISGDSYKVTLPALGYTILSVY